MREEQRQGARQKEVSDVELVNRLVGGDLSAFPLFYHRYARLIRHCIAKRTHLEADDLLQEFFVKLQTGNYKALDHWNRVTPLVNYLAIIVRNFTIDAHRRQFGRTKTSTDTDHPAPSLIGWVKGLIFRGARGGEDDPGDDESDQESDWHAPPDTRWERRELRKQGIRAWSQLSSPRDRRLICGKFHRDTPAEQAALAEGLSGGTFRKAMFDAQRRYMALLRGVAPEFFA